MSWAKVIILAVFSAVLTAALNLIPALNDTSFQDIAVNPEAWILFAMLIIMNCETRWEAVFKTFIFFLISQPLIYLIEAVFGDVGFEVFQYYRYWFFVTLLTIPGAAIAFQVKKGGWPGAVVLSVAIAFLGCMAVRYFRSVTLFFPHHLISMIFCLALAVMMILLFIEMRKPRFFALGILAAAIIVSLVVTKPVRNHTIMFTEGDWTYEIEDPSVVEIEKTGPGSFTVHAGKPGGTSVMFTNENGETREYYISFSSGGVYVSEF